MGSPGLAIFALIVIVAVLLIIGVGIVVAAIVAVSLASLISMGILSASLLVGFQTGSASKGIRLALFQVCAVLGAIAGTGMATAVKLFCHVSLGWTPLESIGLTSGIGIGIVIGASFSTLLKLVAVKFGLEKDRGFEVIPQPAEAAATPNKAQAIQDCFAATGGNSSLTGTEKPGTMLSPVK